ncbi:proprotein convertase P-domain-containing protein, partial [Synechococcus sp. ATX 2A4]|uniref:proprotein convertase P-domain-containing protein n=1 Tax=Synechococcus sp. ATX 2A4 TaxID=2823727 RepID=UPI0020CD5894
EWCAHRGQNRTKMAGEMARKSRKQADSYWICTETGHRKHLGGPGVACSLVAQSFPRHAPVVLNFLSCLSALLLPLLASAPAQATAITASQTYDPVLTIDGGTASTTLFISGLIDSIAKVTTTITLTKCDDPISSTGVCEGIGDSFNNEIGLALKSPVGTVVDLIVPNTVLSGQTPGDTVTWTFDDSALVSISGALLFSGTYLPASSLSAFNGENGNGTWQLIYRDSANLDPLSINSWSLTVIPVPGPLPLLGVGAAFGFSRRLRRRISMSKPTPPQA